MKKILSLLILVSVCLLFQSGTAATQPDNSHAKVRISFTWYYDSGYTDPTGTVSSVAAEINRLRADYPGYTFSNTPGIGLIPIEWGYFSPAITAQIFSNMW